MGELFQSTDIQGCHIYKSSLFKDERGTFTKIFSDEIFKSIGMNIPVSEVFFSTSHENVLRGMHFQAPPHDQVKIVSCLSGRILDVILDLRKSSKTFGKTLSFELNFASEMTLIIPRGCAHGFYAYEDNSIVSYLVETNHNKTADQGIHWDSFGFNWPSGDPIVSSRDQQLPTLRDFVNPFK